MEEPEQQAGGVAADCPQGRGPCRALSEVRRKSRRRGGETANRQRQEARRGLGSTQSGSPWLARAWGRATGGKATVETRPGETGAQGRVLG